MVKFIASEPLGRKGEVGEEKVWDTLKLAFNESDEVVAVWSYRAFFHTLQVKREADILILTQNGGVIVIEVKSFYIEQIETIVANKWKITPPYKPAYVDPFQQAENRVYELLSCCNQDLNIFEKVTGRAIVALPMITKKEWREKGFDNQAHTYPPIIFKDDLEPEALLDCIHNKATRIHQGVYPLNDIQWQRVTQILLGV